MSVVVATALAILAGLTLGAAVVFWYETGRERRAVRRYEDVWVRREQEAARTKGRVEDGKR